jgi:hypothetical protein
MSGSPQLLSRDILCRVTTVHWKTAADLAREVAAYKGFDVAVSDVVHCVTHLTSRGFATSRPRAEAWHRYGDLEFQLTDDGARHRLELLTGPQWSPDAAPPEMQRDEYAW